MFGIVRVEKTIGHNYEYFCYHYIYIYIYIYQLLLYYLLLLSTLFIHSHDVFVRLFHAAASTVLKKENIWVKAGGVM